MLIRTNACCSEECRNLSFPFLEWFGQRSKADTGETAEMQNTGDSKVSCMGNRDFLTLSASIPTTTLCVFISCTRHS